MKVKAKNKNGITKVKAMAKHDMITYDQAKKKGVKANFITHWEAKVNGKVVYEISTSQFLSKNPIIKFQFKGGNKGDKIEMTWIDKLGNTKTKKTKIK
jgi:sulfur-oxidizing protein SoxZ